MRLSGFFIIWHSYRIYLYEWNPPEIRYLIIFVKLIVIYPANQGLFMREKGFSFKDCLFAVSARRGGRQEGGRGPHEGGAPGAGEIEVTWGLFVQIIKWKYFFLHRQEAIKQAERERRLKYRKQDEEREVIRSAIREKVGPVPLDPRKYLHQSWQQFSLNLKIVN